MNVKKMTEYTDKLMEFVTGEEIKAKRPMPLDTDTKRDAYYRDAIINFEKKIIEPRAINYVNSLPAGTPVEILIRVDVNEKTDLAGEMESKTSSDGLRYGSFTIGGDMIRERLGGNEELIKNIIADIYRQEGFKVEVEGRLIIITKGE